ncbi:MAG: glutathione S-transferase family protein [Betaproteobacteria bacterium]|nr:glutathione S-transferase family protein [Betaproteobacteria bacterium]NBT11558.1 glutathione S-transferase family protein [Betaproteobacteria bacterium]NBU48702.1 glutathione S-transferase family protein [Betaproteobacteria bacterium]NBX96451.1 glutathione S-transferase family protein [Betaproteobacteria bacterium]
MILYDLPAGMHPRRVRIFMAEKGLTIPTQVVDAAKRENQEPEFLRLNPLGRLPVLQLDDGTALSESLAICRYLEMLHPQPPLFGEGAQQAAVIDMWTRRMEQQVSNAIVDIFMHASDFYRNRITQVPAFAEWSREKIMKTLTWLDSEMAHRPFIAGHDYTMADIVAQCAFVLGKAVAIRIPADHVHLTRWFAEVSARPTARA